MLLQNTPCLENVIIRLLSQSASGLTAQALIEQVAQSFKRYSRRGVYKELQRLIAEGVIVRSQSLYSIRFAWILSLRNELEALYAHTLNPDYLKQSLPTKERKILVHSTDLVGWDRVWTQLMLLLHTNFPDLPMFIWCPRHWFTITHPEIENTFMQANEAKKHLRFAIVGGRGPLDLRDRRILARKSTGYSYRLSPFEFDRNHYYWIIGDYCGTSTLDLRTAKKIEDLYRQTEKISEIGPHTRNLLLSQKIRGSVRCEWAPEKAERLRQKFLKFFNLKLDQHGRVIELRKGEL